MEGTPEPLQEPLFSEVEKQYPRRWSDHDFLKPKEGIRPQIYLSLTALSVILLIAGWMILAYGGIVDES